MTHLVTHSADSEADKWWTTLRLKQSRYCIDEVAAVTRLHPGKWTLKGGGCSAFRHRLRGGFILNTTIRK